MITRKEEFYMGRRWTQIFRIKKFY